MRATSCSSISRPSRRRLDDDIAELARVLEAALRRHRIFEGVVAGVRRRRADRAARDLHVLLAQRLHDVARRHAVGRELFGIEPDAQRIFALAEDDEVADAVEAQQHVAHPRAGIVRDIELVVGVVRRQHVHDHHQVGRALGGGDAEAAHLFRQPRLGDRHAVLHQHLRLIEIGAELEGDGQRHRAVAGRIGGHVEHVLDAVDLLLDRRRDGLGDRLGIGAGILRAARRWSAARSPDIARPAAGCRRCRRRSAGRSTGPSRRSAGRRRNARISLVGPAACAFGGSVTHLGLDLDAGPDAHQPVDDDRSRRPSALRGSRDSRRACGPVRTGLAETLPVGVHHIDDAPVLVGADRLVGNAGCP